MDNDRERADKTAVRLLWVIIAQLSTILLVNFTHLARSYGDSTRSPEGVLRARA